MTDGLLLKTIKHNCDISDARDNGIYSICTLVLKLRNLYKWEHGLEPWEVEQGFVLACQSTPQSDELVLDYDKT